MLTHIKKAVKQISVALVAKLVDAHASGACCLRQWKFKSSPEHHIFNSPFGDFFIAGQLSFISNSFAFLDIFSIKTISLCVHDGKVLKIEFSFRFCRVNKKCSLSSAITKDLNSFVEALEEVTERGRYSSLFCYQLNYF